MARAGVRTALLVAALAVAGCQEEPELQLGPPRCEPARELDLERLLKGGFRALYEGDLERARASFAQVESEEPGHPEAGLGLRLAGRRATLPPTRGPARVGRTEVLIAGQPFDVGVEVETQRFRAEDLAVLAQARGEKGARWEARATAAGASIEPQDPGAVRAVVDLVVLSDTLTSSLAERIAAQDAQSAASHFIIDWDGQVYQTLDLAWAPRGAAGDLASRAVTIELLNPSELQFGGALPDGSTRARAGPTTINGRQLEHWGYTEAQLQSVERLILGLLAQLPQVPRKLPLDDGAVARRAVASEQLGGIVGRLHLSREAADPGAGFPWERLQRAITP